MEMWWLVIRRFSGSLWRCGGLLSRDVVAHYGGVVAHYGDVLARYGDVVTHYGDVLAH